MVACKIRAGFQRCQIGAGARFRVSLAPPDVTFQNVGQEALLLLVAAEGVYHGPDHVEAERNNLRRIGLGGFGHEDVFLNGRPACAAVLGGPVHACPALLVQALLIVNVVVFFKRDSTELSFAYFSGNRVLEKCSDFVAKCELVIAESNVHLGPFSSSETER